MFRLHSDEAPLFHDIADPYREFVLETEPLPDDECVDVRFSISTIPPPAGARVFDGGSWGVYASGFERSMVFQTRTMAEPLFEARFRPGSREVQVRCAPRLLETAGGVTGIRSHFRYPLDQVLAMYLLGERGLILHAAGLVRGGEALVFAGISGAGKSTVTRLANAWEGTLPLSDDRIILRVDDGYVVAHGTPWPGEADVAERRHARVGGLLFLEKGERNAVRTTRPRETLARLLPTVSLPWYDPPYLESGLRACDAIVRRLPAGVFTFRPETGAIRVLEGFPHALEREKDNNSPGNQ